MKPQIAQRIRLTNARKEGAQSEDAHSPITAREVGLAAFNRNDVETARATLEAYCLYDANDPKVLMALGIIYLKTNDPELAVKRFKTAASAAPNSPEIQNNLATAHLYCHNPLEARAAAETALKLRPNFSPAWNTLGNAQRSVGNLPKAAKAFRKALEQDPQLTAAMVNLGQTLLDQNEAGGALDIFLQARDLEPENAEVSNGLGLALQNLDRRHEAKKAFEHAIKSNNQHPSALGNLATLLQQEGRSEEALSIYRDALAFDPNNPGILENLGHILQGLGHQTEAAEIFQNLANNNNNITPHLLHARMHLCNWEDYEELTAKVLKIVSEDSNEKTVPPFALLGISTTPSIRLKAAKRSADKAAEHVSNLSTKKSTYHVSGIENKNRPMRIGYVSPDFRTHSLGQTFDPLLRAHNKKDFKVYGYSTNPSSDSLQNQLQGAFSCFRDVSRDSALDIANCIREDKIDILVDLAGHTRGTRLEVFALKPAPVQAHYLGYGATIGADYIPWLISDSVHTPRELEAYCSESLVLLPDSFMATTPPVSLARPKPRSDHNLPDSAMVYAAFNANYKFEPSVFACWMNILNHCHKAVLWLKASTSKAEANLRREAEKAGINPNRLIFAQRLPRSEHIARLSLADVALDTFLHNGGVTTVDALTAGLPVVTCAGINHSERTGASLLTAANLENLVTHSPAQYLDLALQLAENTDMRLRLKERVQRSWTSSALFDVSRLALNLETAYYRMHECRINGQRPRVLRIKPSGTDGNDPISKREKT